MEDGDIVRHEFYEKEVSSKQVVHSRSALCSGSKTAIIASEVLRRMLNSDNRHSWYQMKELILEYDNMMRRAGHKHPPMEECPREGYSQLLHDTGEGETRGEEIIQE